MLVLDEVNRCNLAAVLGELVMTLEADKRGKAQVLLQRPPPPGSDLRSLTVPPNLLILGTMNTADRGTSHIDFAIRRRFRFIDIDASEGALVTYYGRLDGEESAHRTNRATQLFRAFNKQVTDRRHRVGHSFFMVDTGTRSGWASTLRDRINFEVCPLIREYYRAGHARQAPVEITECLTIHPAEPGTESEALHSWLVGKEE